jgi:hypothetical protein
MDALHGLGPEWCKNHPCFDYFYLAKESIIFYLAKESIMHKTSMRWKLQSMRCSDEDRNDVQITSVSTTPRCSYYGDVFMLARLVERSGDYESTITTVQANTWMLGSSTCFTVIDLHSQRNTHLYELSHYSTQRFDLWIYKLLLFRLLLSIEQINHAQEMDRWKLASGTGCSIVHDSTHFQIYASAPPVTYIVCNLETCHYRQYRS